ncbi:hypothetical protein E4U42_006493 [Claviceps africana]|uniref:Sulphur transport domain-containing protein n=1 Tax=Claviceps africana TaxID=83212 RepID=A0A8K0NEY6_9HYPO|nr:hypothetical protein E4U42_006493 [Claviceps africana]
MAATAISGAAFGAAMAAAGFHDPGVVVSQFKWESWHMAQAFLAATAASAAIYSVAERLGYVRIPPRKSSPLGLFSTYDGNVLGGALLGAGMALAGSCPGTLYAQLAAGVRSGLHALDGAIVGGILWTGFLAKGVQRLREKHAVRPEPGIVSEQLGLSRAATVLLLETACVGVMIATMTLHAPEVASAPASAPASVAGARMSGVVGGLLIGAAQLVSILTRRSMLGISGSYEEMGFFFWWLVRGARVDAKPASHSNMLFASGVAAGAWALLTLAPGLAAAPVADVPPSLAMAGGVLMAVGSRLAGGCTSGHGISGISLLSTSSVVTIGTAFTVGALVAPLAH